jgi:phage tail protein X
MEGFDFSAPDLRGAREVARAGADFYTELPQTLAAGGVCVGQWAGDAVPQVLSLSVEGGTSLVPVPPSMPANPVLRFPIWNGNAAGYGSSVPSALLRWEFGLGRASWSRWSDVADGQYRLPLCERWSLWFCTLLATNYAAPLRVGVASRVVSSLESPSDVYQTQMGDQETLAWTVYGGGRSILALTEGTLAVKYYGATKNLLSIVVPANAGAADLVEVPVPTGTLSCTYNLGATFALTSLGVAVVRSSLGAV